jgi:hypothetical protein
MEKTSITQNQIVNEILHIGHGDLSIYTETGLKAVGNEPELLAHLIAWNQKRGEIRDSKVALPIIALHGYKDYELFENAAAHLCLLSPRNLVRAIRYHKSIPVPAIFGGSAMIKQAVEKYLKTREQKPSWWDKTALQHRKSMKTLYAMNHIKPSPRANKILFKRQYPINSVFQKVKQLKDMPPVEAAGTILNHKIPFLVAVGAIGGLKDKTDLLIALIERMSGSELINNTNMLKRFGVMDNPALKAAYNNGLEKAKTDKKVSTLKAGQAAKAVGDKKLSKKLEKVQEQKLDNKSIEGDWLVLGDKSGSMRTAIEVARKVASIIARQVKGSVHLVFFDTKPRYINVTGKSYEDIYNETKRITADGGTSIGCGLKMIQDKNIIVNGIAICSDGGDNTVPYFHSQYNDYCDKMGMEPTVYLFHVPGDWNALEDEWYSAKDRIRYHTPLEIFELGHSVDYYALPQLALTMRTSAYSLVEEIMDTKLLTFNDVFK